MAGIVSSENIPRTITGYAKKHFKYCITQKIREKKATDSVQEELASD